MPCCNGLVCLASRSDVLLWNLSTDELRELPNLISQSYRVHAFGFCYDDSNDDILKYFLSFVVILVQNLKCLFIA